MECPSSSFSCSFLRLIIRVEGDLFQTTIYNMENLGSFRVSQMLTIRVKFLPKVE